MKFIRSNRPVSILQLSSPLFVAFLLSSTTVMAKEQPNTAAETAKADGKKTKSKADKAAEKPVVLDTMEVTEKNDQKLAAASAEVALSPGGVSVVDITGLHDRNVYPA